MVPATPSFSTSAIPAADVDVMTLFFPIPSLGFVPINAFLLRAREPVLVDTGPIVMRDVYIGALKQLIDLEDLRWIYLTHADPDHVGALTSVLAAAPKARIITTFLGLGRLGLYHEISPERVFLLNPGQHLSVGDRELHAVSPVAFDSPETTPFIDSKTGVLFSSDCFGGIVDAPFERANDIPAGALREGVITWSTIDTPWLGNLDTGIFEAKVRRIRDLDAPIVLSSHLPPALGMLDVLLDHIAAARTRSPWVGPDQVALTAILAAMTAPPASNQARELRT